MMRGGLWRANPPRKQLDFGSKGGGAFQFVEKDGVAVGVKAANASADAPMLYEYTEPVEAARRVAAEQAKQARSLTGGGSKVATYAVIAALAALVVRKVRKLRGGRR